MFYVFTAVCATLVLVVWRGLPKQERERPMHLDPFIQCMDALLSVDAVPSKGGWGPSLANPLAVVLFIPSARVHAGLGGALTRCMHWPVMRSSRR